MMDEFQAMDMARQILEGNPYPIKVIFGMGMNARMFPDSQKMFKALESVGFFVQSELFMTDTAKYADILLPACTSFERGEFKAYPGGFAAFTKPVIPKLYECKSDVEILSDLVKVMGIDDPILAEGYDAGVRFMLQDLSVSVEGVKSAGLPVRVPEARDPQPGEFLKAGFKTATGKFEFAASVAAEFGQSHGLSQIPVYSGPHEDEPDAIAFPFILNTGSRLPHALHSRLHDMPWLRAMCDMPQIDINAEDAKGLGLRDGDWAEVSSSQGSLRIQVRPSMKILPGVVHLYHSYREANANDLICSDHLDPYSGFPGFKSVRCSIRPL